jgi:hypothetical protein
MLWFIELHLYEPRSPVFVNVDKVTEMHPAEEGTIIAFDHNKNFIHVNESYEKIKGFMIDKMTGERRAVENQEAG